MTTVSVGLLATKDTSASSLFGLYDTLSGAGQAWETFVTGESPAPVFDITIISHDQKHFRCAGGTQIHPDKGIKDVTELDLLVVPGMSVSALQPPNTIDNEDIEWVKGQYEKVTRVVAACSGAVYLAEIGLLDGVEATTHWAYKNLFQNFYPKVKLNLDRNICFENSKDGIVTSGGTTAWQELSLFLIQNYGGMEQAKRTAKFWLMADRGDFQTPYSSMITANENEDAIVHNALVWLADNYHQESPVTTMIERSGLPPTTFSRRFRKGTGLTTKDYIHAVRVEEAKKRLETTELNIDEIGREVGYEDTSSFRRIFKRKTSLSPAKYRNAFGTERFSRYSE